MAEPTFSVLLTWANRPELARTLVDNHAIYGHHAPEVVIVNCGGDFRALGDLVSQAGVPHVRIVDLPGIPFNKSLALNIAAHVSRGSYLALGDVDMFARFDILGFAQPYLERGGAFVTARALVESDPTRGDTNLPELAFAREVVHEQTYTTHDGRRAVLKVRKFTGVKFGDPIVVLRKADFVATGGLSSHLKGWGYEDTDFQLRLQFQLGLERIEHGEVVHLTHTARARSQQSFQRNMMQCFKEYARGNYLGTFELDRAAWGHARVECPLLTMNCLE